MMHGQKNIKKITASLLTIMLIERHVSANSEAIIRFYDC